MVPKFAADLVLTPEDIERGYVRRTFRIPISIYQAMRMVANKSHRTVQAQGIVWWEAMSEPETCTKEKGVTEE